MAVVELVSHENSIEVNGREQPKNTYGRQIVGNRVALYYAKTLLVVTDGAQHFSEFRINGAEPETLEELLNWITANFFKSASQGGGGSSQNELYTDIVLNALQIEDLNNGIPYLLHDLDEGNSPQRTIAIPTMVLVNIKQVDTEDFGGQIQLVERGTTDYVVCFIDANYYGSDEDVMVVTGVNNDTAYRANKGYSLVIDGQFITNYLPETQILIRIYYKRVPIF